MKLKCKKDIRSKIVFGLILLSVGIHTSINSEANSEDIIKISSISTFGERNKSDIFNHVEKTSDGGFVVAGQTFSENLGFTNGGNGDAVMIKYNKNGEQEFINTLSGSFADEFESVIQTSDGSYIAVGNSSSSDAGFVPNGYGQGVIVKYDNEGNHVWTKGSNGNEVDYFNGVVEASDGGYIAVGSSDSTNFGYTYKGYGTAIIAKYNKDGDQEFVKPLDGKLTEELTTIKKLKDGGYVVVGDSCSDDLGFAHVGSTDAIIAKLDEDLELEWINSFGGSSSERFHSVTETLDGGCVAVGYTWSSDAGIQYKESADFIVVKYDKDGTKKWVKNISGTSSDIAYDAIPTPDNGVLVVGEIGSGTGYGNVKNKDAIMLKYDEDGNEEFYTMLSGEYDEGYYGITETTEGNIVVIGTSESEQFIPNLNDNYAGIAVIYKYVTAESKIEELIEKAEESKDPTDIENARTEVNKLPEGDIKDDFQDRLNTIVPIVTGSSNTASANVDIYIHAENSISLSLDTNSVTFDNYSGVEPVELKGAATLSISSSLPYDIKAYMPSNISNADGSETIGKQFFNIKESSEDDYQQFTDNTTALVLKADCPSVTEATTHKIDMKLDSNESHKPDVYKTVVKFEAVQK